MTSASSTAAGTGAADARPRCSVGARARGDSRVGTAARASGFLLIEEPGRWGVHALRDSAFDPVVGHRIAERFAAETVRVLLIRRPGRRARPTNRQWFYVDCEPGAEAVYAGDFHHDRELLRLSPAEPAGQLHGEPLYLVCTHGLHDTCCAVEGRPVAAALAAVRPDQTWECSHLGGDRFAANLLVLPHGLTYGSVDASSAVSVVESYERGLVAPKLLRGRSYFPPAVQAAQDFARTQLGDLSIDGAAPAAIEPRGDAWYVEVCSGGGRLGVTVRAVPDPPGSMLTCRADHLGVPRHFELVGIEPVVAGAAGN